MHKNQHIPNAATLYHEKKKFDEHNKKEKDKDVEKIVDNVNKLIEKELLKISKGIDSEDAAEIK